MGCVKRDRKRLEVWYFKRNETGKAFEREITQIFLGQNRVCIEGGDGASSFLPLREWKVL